MNKHSNQLVEPLVEDVAERMAERGYVFDADTHEWIAPVESDDDQIDYQE